jgi:hypothetical protein
MVMYITVETIATISCGCTVELVLAEPKEKTSHATMKGQVDQPVPFTKVKASKEG